MRDLSLVFFVPDLRRIIREGEISRGVLGKGKKSIDLESVVLLYQGEIIFSPSNQSYWKLHMAWYIVIVGMVPTCAKRNFGVRTKKLGRLSYRLLSTSQVTIETGLPGDFLVTSGNFLATSQISLPV